jgi:hypothetical protein
MAFRITMTRTQGDLHSFLLNFMDHNILLSNTKPYVRVQRYSVIAYFACGKRVALF